MHSPYASSDSESGISLATMTAGIVAAVMFLLISSFVSNESTWTLSSDRVWAARTLTGAEMAGNKVMMPSAKVMPFEGQAETAAETSNQDKAGHFLDALYRSEFMSIFTEPT